MRSVVSFFGGFKNLIASVAQILIAIILLPFICFILKLILPANGISFILNLLQEIPFLDVWFDMVQKFAEAPKDGVLVQNYLQAVIQPALDGAFEALIIGMCVYACKTIGTMLYIRGVPVIQTVAGVFLGCITIKAIGVGDTYYSIFAIGFLVILNIVLTLLAAHGQVLQKVLGIFIGIGCQSILAGLAAAYVAALCLIINGWANSLGAAVGLIGVTVCPLLIFLLIDYFILTPKKLA